MSSTHSTSIFTLIPYVMLDFACLTLQAYGTPTYSEARVAFENCEYKKAIDAYQELLKSADKESVSPLKVKLASAFYKDQDQEKAFTVFLEALETAVLSAQSPSQITQEEQNLYKQGLEIYLHHNGMTSWEVAGKIRENYAETIRNHPDYHVLGYLVAASYANLEQFEQFFELFYRSYLHLPEHYMAYKTKAILHAKLLERSRTPVEREKQRLEILSNLSLAAKLNPHDTTLYKMILSITKESDKQNVVNIYLNKIIDDGIIIPRTDMMFYVEQAVKSKQLDLAQSFLNKARVWYPASRTIDQAQQYIYAQKFQEKGKKENE